MEVNITFTFWNQLNRCLVEIENKKYLKQEWDHIYDKYVNSIEINGFVIAAREEERKKIANNKDKSNDINVECFACHENFQIDFNVPSYQKKFYWKCTKYGAKIKRGNPNYKES